MITEKTNKRLLSLDVMRGITIAGMILVNNPGSWGSIYAPLQHAAWHGLTPTDLIFPFFMFIMGISTFISLSKFNFEPTSSTIFKILKRTVVIFVIGVGLSWLSVSIHTYNGLGSENLNFFNRIFQSITNFEHVRILGVMQRLALTYGITALIAVYIKHKYIPFIIIASLLIYYLILVLGHGFETGEQSILSIVDRAILGVNHMYIDSGIEPEGILSTIPSIAHVLIGFYCGKILLEVKDNKDRMINLFVIGAVLTFTGFLLSYGCPINKKIWSPTFVITTCGLGATLLSLLIYIIDVNEWKQWTIFFESFGVNPLFMYVSAAVIATLFEGVLFNYGGELMGFKDFSVNVILNPYLDVYLSSLVYALFLVTINWLIGNVLYKNKIYIKI